MSILIASEAPSHRDIIARNGGPSATGRKINIDPNTVKAWSRLDSIPAPHWQAFADTGAATLEELASAAALRKAAANSTSAEAA